jgi:hypothetical protein
MFAAAKLSKKDQVFGQTGGFCIMEMHLPTQHF